MEYFLGDIKLCRDFERERLGSVVLEFRNHSQKGGEKEDAVPKEH